MDPFLLAGLGLGGMLVLIALHMPIGIAMGLTGYICVGLVLGWGPAVTLFGTETSAVLSSNELAVIPLFLLMGSFATAAGLSSDLYKLAYALLGHRRGGLALSTIGGCAGFGAICGSSVATTATMAQIALPEMRQRGYSAALSSGCIASGGSLGMLIPPSIIMVLYAFLTEQFVIALFVAAIVPGILAVIFYFVVIYVHVRIHPESGPAGDPMPWSERLSVLRDSWAVITLALVVTVGIYGGIFTVNEAAAVGATLALLITVVRGRLTRQVFWGVLGETAANTGMIYMIIIGASILTYFVVLSQLPDALVGAIEGTGLPPLAIIFLLQLMYIVLGSIFDTVASMVITLPFVFPLVVGLGYDPIWWGVINIVVIEIGMITPPIGINVFVLHGMAKDIPLNTIFAGIVPFLIADVARLIVLTMLPVVTLWLPGLTGTLGG
jgi:tripartite ATP-independent transporter DctM subunit